MSDHDPHKPAHSARGARLDLSFLRDDIGFQIHITRRALARSLRAFRKRPKAQEPSGYNATLVLIGANPGVSPQDIARALFLDTPNLAVILRLMTQQGLILREQDKNDRRRSSLKLTPVGAARLKELAEVSAAHSHRAGRGLTEEETRQLSALLVKVQQALF